MFNIFSNNYLSRGPIEIAMKKFARNFHSDQKVLDIGCGKKPYVKYFSCKYTGLDPYREVKPDIIANAWEIPVSENSFDGIIFNQSLEHIEKTAETILEIKRVLKPGGSCIITVPQTMKIHSLPLSSQNSEYNNFDKANIPYWNNDFYRFTKFGLIYLFRDFQILELKEISGYFGTLFQMMNYFFASLNIRYIFTPIYFVNNILGLFFDFIFFILSKINIRVFKRFYETIYLSLTLNYIMIVKK